MAPRLILAGVLLCLSACGGTDAPEPEPGAQDQDWLAVAADAEQRGAPAEAAEALDRWAAAHEPDAAWRARRLAAAEALSDWDTAVYLRRSALEQDPEDLTAALELADTLQQAGRGSEAVDLLAPYAADAAAQPRVLRAQAELYRREQRWSEAAAATEALAAAAEGTERAWLYQQAAEDREQARDYAAALEDMRQALTGAALDSRQQQALTHWLAFQTGKPENVADAIALLQTHPDPELRLAGARYLADQRFEQELVVLAGALGDEDARVVRVCAAAFCARAGAAQAPQLGMLLRSRDPEVRLQAARALGELGSAADAPALIAALDPDDRALFRAANLALERLSGASVCPELDPDPAARAAAAAAWRAWWSQHAPQPL